VFALSALQPIRSLEFAALLLSCPLRVEWYDLNGDFLGATVAVLAQELRAL
jgi:hypothetical protein